MFKRVANLQQPPQLLRPVSNESVAFQTTSEHAGVLGSADERREEAFGEVLAGVASANGAAAVVDYDGGVVEVGHGGFGRVGVEGRRRDALGGWCGEVLLTFTRWLAAC